MVNEVDHYVRKVYGRQNERQVKIVVVSAFNTSFVLSTTAVDVTSRK